MTGDSRSPGQPLEISLTKPQLLVGRGADRGGMTHPGRECEGLDSSSGTRNEWEFKWGHLQRSQAWPVSSTVVSVIGLWNIWGTKTQSPKPKQTRLWQIPYSYWKTPGLIDKNYQSAIYTQMPALWLLHSWLLSLYEFPISANKLLQNSASKQNKIITLYFWRSKVQNGS